MHRHLDPEALTAGLPAPWADDARRALTALQDALTPEPSAEPGACPVCLGVSVLCDHGPDLLDRVSELAAGLAQALRGAGPDDPADLDETTGAGQPADGERGTAPLRRPAPPTTVRIDVSD